jgi:hypothetical protein
MGYGGCLGEQLHHDCLQVRVSLPNQDGHPNYGNHSAHAAANEYPRCDKAVLNRICWQQKKTARPEDRYAVA